MNRDTAEILDTQVSEPLNDTLTRVADQLRNIANVQQTLARQLKKGEKLLRELILPLSDNEGSTAERDLSGMLDATLAALEEHSKLLTTALEMPSFHEENGADNEGTEH